MYAVAALRRLILPLALAALLAPATADAASFGELPPTALAGAGSCLHATGAPGELVHDAGQAGTGPTPLQILEAGPGGAVTAGLVPLGHEALVCAAMAARPGGAALAAGTDVDLQGPTRIVVADRPAGGAFAAPVTVASERGWFVEQIVSGLSERGDALVAWLEINRSRTRVRAVLRPAGGAFGAPVVLASRGTPLWLTGAMSAGGDAVLAWATSRGDFLLSRPVQVHATIAPAGRPFGAPRVVGEAPDGRAPSLAMADDGRALLALPAPGVLRVAERPPGGAFGAPAIVARGHGTGRPAAVALGAGGRAVIAWTAYPDGGMWMVERAATGAFGPVATLAARSAPQSEPTGGSVAFQAGVGGEALGIGEESDVAVALTPGGALAAWLAPRETFGQLTTGVRTAVVPTGGGPVQRSVLGGGLRDAEDLHAFPLPGGDVGVAWLELGASTRARLHLAVAGGTRPADPPAPTVRVGRPLHTVLKYDQPVDLPVSCSAACDVRAQTAGGRADGQVALGRAGHAVLKIEPLERPIAAPRGGLVRLRLAYGAPGAAHPALRTLTVRLRLRALPPRPRAHDLRAERGPGDRIRVTWATDVAVANAVYLVTGEAKRGGRPLTLDGAIGTRHRRRFAVTLRHVRGVRFVTLETFVGFTRARLTVRVR